MSFKQTGRKVSRAKSLGALFASFILICLLLYLTGLILSIRDGDNLNALVFPTVMYILVICTLTIAATFNIWMFPDIELGVDGIVLNALFYKRKIAWSEIEGISRNRQEIYIILSRNGLLLNRFYGLLYAKVWDKPIVIFTSDKDILNKLENDLNSSLLNTI